MQSEGSDACQRALDTVIKLPEAKELFSESLDRFRDVTCIGLCNWANVHLCHAKKLLEHGAEQNKKPNDIKKEFEEHCKEALKRYNEALGYNSAPPPPRAETAGRAAAAAWAVPPGHPSCDGHGHAGDGLNPLLHCSGMLRRPGRADARVTLPPADSTRP